MDFQSVRQVILEKLKNELPAYLTYHGVSHVLDVMRVAKELGEAEGVKGEDLTLLCTAALFHDTGYIFGADGHEQRSCEIAAEYLPKYGYSPEQIGRIKGMIMATKLPQSPNNLLEEILADADLDYLGRDDFFSVDSKLYEELRNKGAVKTEREWDALQRKFFEDHSFFTETSRARRNKKKAENLNLIKLRLKKKSQRRMSTSKRHHLFTISDIVYLILSVVSASFALKSFLVPNHFLDGGITGISLLLFEMYDWNLGLVLIILNIPFIVLAFMKVNRNFGIRSSLTIILIALMLYFVPFPELTHDKLLIAVFGGFFIGIGIGLAMRGGGTFDGMEVIAQLTTKKSGFSITEIILGLNMIIFIFAAIFLRVETALYAILTYVIAGQTTRYVIEGIEAYTGVTIVSANSSEIKKMLVLSLNKGITVYKGERGFMKEHFEVSNQVDIIFTIVTRLEVRRIRNIVHSIDPKAFVFTQTVREPQGGIVKEIVKH